MFPIYDKQSGGEFSVDKVRVYVHPQSRESESTVQGAENDFQKRL